MNIQPPWNRADFVDEDRRINPSWAQFFVVLSAQASQIGFLSLSTTAALSSAGNSVNTMNKAVGLTIGNSTTKNLMVASGPLATDTWLNFSGGSDITPV
jgi:hypothetical protein